MLLISAFSPQRLSLCGIEVRLPAAHFVPVRGSYYRSGLHRQLKPQAPDPPPGFQFQWRVPKKRLASGQASRFGFSPGG